MHRFYLSSLPQIIDQKFTLNSKEHSDLYYQLKNVLRAKLDDSFLFFDQNGQEYLCKIATQEHNTYTLTILAQNSVDRELPYILTLIQALPQKADKWEWILQKGTELGVTKFIPLITARTQRHSLPKSERMDRIIIEAAEQSGRIKIPQVLGISELSALHFQGQQMVLFASLLTKQNLIALLPQKQTAVTEVVVIIGPEGGFTEKEEEKLMAIGAIPFSLGKRVLRLETAAIASLSIVAQIYS
ncbi:MAG: 16S rRNA (uracil(1498)-N(3))-methyltransferase [Candidatus Abawacabacteria bacterium]|nr:16S rRNA (uracil(1498)-N(3))-methyltransferase [Candidatus Abawacabacteria bacterium]